MSRPIPFAGGRLRACAPIVIVVVLLLVAGTATALPPPAEVGGEPIRFPSTSPFVLAEAGEDAPPMRAEARLFLPDGAAEPVPAVVLLHGAGGVSWARERRYARQFAAAGWAALVVDVFGARVAPGTGFTERLLNITEAMFLADAYAGLRFLADHPRVDGERVALVGFSYGGMASIYALHEQVRRRYARDGGRFVAHAAYYAPCIARFERVATTGAPLLMLYGTADAIVDRDRCGAVVDDLRRGGSEVVLEVYEGAAHRWDGGASDWRAPRGLADCRFRVAPDGRVRDLRTRLTLDGFLARTAALALCADEEGYRIRGDAATKARSDAALERFLARAFEAAG
jgi:dienelactone hydrolase